MWRAKFVVLALAWSRSAATFETALEKAQPRILIPQLQVLPPQLRSFAPQSKRVKARFGPFATADVDVEIFGVAGHLHLGGYLVEIFQNEKVICKSRATYSQASNTTSNHASRMRLGDEDAETEAQKTARRPEADGDGHAWYIRQMSTCSKLGRVKKGDVFYKKSHYDLGKYHGMRNMDGTWMNVEGIAVMTLAVEQ